MTPSTLLATCVLLIAAMLASPVLACPYGSQFFAYGGAGGCVANGKMTQKCFNMGKVCPSGWSNEGASDTGSWCCPPPPGPKGSNCTLRGTAPVCAGECEIGETLKSRTATRTQGCVTGSKAFCCR